MWYRRPTGAIIVSSIERLFRSFSIALSMPGYCTFTATRSPPRVVARCTCPMLAAANGSASHSAKTSEGGPPSSSPMTRTAASRESGGAFCWSVLRTDWNFSSYPGGARPSMYEAIWPSFSGQALHLAERLEHRLGRLLRAAEDAFARDALVLLVANPADRAPHGLGGHRQRAGSERPEAREPPEARRRRRVRPLRRGGRLEGLGALRVGAAGSRGERRPCALGRG